METVYWNNDERLGMPVSFTIPEMIHQYRIAGWDVIEDEDFDGTTTSHTMTDDEIEDDILSHDIQELGPDNYAYANRGDVTVRIDLSRPETSVDYRIDNDDWEASPFQSVRFRCGAGDEQTALGAVIEWLDGQS